MASREPRFEEKLIKSHRRRASGFLVSVAAAAAQEIPEQAAADPHSQRDAPAKNRADQVEDVEEPPKIPQAVLPRIHPLSIVFVR